MLKNASNAPLELMWGGVRTLLQPGQSCRYINPAVELRMKSKYGSSLEHVPDVLPSQVKIAEVLVNPVENPSIEKSKI